MKLQTKIFAATAMIFLVHFISVEYFGQKQIKTEVLDNIKENARTVYGMLMSLRSVYQQIYLTHNIPITEKTLEFLPAHSISRISKEFTNWVDTGLSFNNVTDRPRNPKNQADKTEMQAIRFFRDNPDESERFIPYINPQGAQFYHFSQPIYIEPRCLKCHGARKDAPASIRDNYTSAYDYKLGDLRGIVSIKLPVSIIEERTSELLQQNIVSHIVGLLLAYLFISLLFHHTVLHRIKKLQHGAERLASGDYNSLIESTGNDEISQVTESFNRMTNMISQREQSLLKQRSLYSALSQINKTIIQVDSQQLLFQRICDIATAQDGITFAWVGLIDMDAKELVPAASSGDIETCMGNYYFSLDINHPRGTGPITEVALTGQYIVINDYLTDSRTTFWRAQAKKAQIFSIAVFPVKLDKKIIGTFAVYSEQKNFFTRDITELLIEATNDVSFAIKNYELERSHQQSQLLLEQSSHELKKINKLMIMLLESTGEGIYGLDNTGRCTFINRSALEILGYPDDDLHGQVMHSLIHHSHADGSRYHSSNCPIYSAFHDGKACRVNTEVFWRKDGTSFPVEYSAHPVHDKSLGITGAVILFHDITVSQAMTRKMDYLATHDSLTSLLNRYSFDQQLEVALQSAKINASQHALCYLDLDQFKIINDTCGHIAGDHMLKLIAALLQHEVRKNDTLARLGGDEFGLLLEECDIEQASELGQKICDAIKDFRFRWEEKIFTSGVSIGIVTISSDTESIHSAMSAADSACYIAKEMGRNRIHVQQLEDDEIARQHGEMQWVSIIHEALEKDRFELYHQPIETTHIACGKTLYFEILLRMLDKKGNIILPGAFLPAAERYNLMSELDRWVIQSTFNYLSTHPEQLSNIGFCSINLSGQSIGDEALFFFILEHAKENNIDPARICFEITETTAVSRLDLAMPFIKRLKSHGFLFALDDFGTGMSSFAYLKNLPVDFLKIDGCFIRDIINDPIDRSMVKSINDIGHMMGLKTIAEYVENDAIRQELINIGADYLQGYAIARPAPLL
jgi:diguanylate cyclase (GGDEF)-like protein/PAS domain S-box-containing protein